jgi:hypothetical protein
MNLFWGESNAIDELRALLNFRQEGAPLQIRHRNLYLQFKV